MVKISKTEHYFCVNPKVEKKEYKIVDNIFGHPLEFVTASAIFSPRELDTGSLTLVKYMVLKKNTRILDLGCGYGLIGIMAAKFCPSSSVTMADINKRAVECARENIKINLVPNIKVKQSHTFSGMKDEMFDTILLNPPISAGREACFEMIEKSYNHINEGGNLQVVARNKKGGKMLAEKMEELFGNIEVIGKSGGFFVYFSEKRSAEDLKK